MHDFEIIVKAEIDLEDAFSHLPSEFGHTLSEIVDQPTMGIENNYIRTITDISYMFYHGLKYAIDKGKIFLACNTLYTALSGYTDWKLLLDDALEQHNIPVPVSYLHLSDSRTMEKRNMMNDELKNETQCFIESIEFAKRHMHHCEDSTEHPGFGHTNLLNPLDIVFTAVIALLPQNIHLPIFDSSYLPDAGNN